MENKKEKIYVGSGVEKFDGDLVQASVCLTDITNNAKDFIFEYEGKKYIKLKVVKKRETDQYGKTHYVEVDTWKPEPKTSEPVKQDDDLPF
tara:strand:+ start:905 stop:1177 length:273 start_codon:yes stop_codon:yes gene_type:complete